MAKRKPKPIAKGVLSDAMIAYVKKHKRWGWPHWGESTAFKLLSRKTRKPQPEG